MTREVTLCLGTSKDQIKGAPVGLDEQFIQHFFLPVVKVLNITKIQIANFRRDKGRNCLFMTGVFNVIFEFGATVLMHSLLHNRIK